MSTVTLPTDLTKEKLTEMEPAELIKLISTPEGKVLVEQVWNAQPEALGGSIVVVPTAEEIAAAEADAIAIADAQRIADEAKAAEEVRKQAEAEAERKKQTPTKFVFDKEIKDGSGNVVRRVHLEAASQDELNQKIADSYSRLTEAYEDLKVKKLTVKKEAPAEPTMSDDELEALVKEIRKGDDPKSAVAALKKVTGLDTAEAQKKKLAEQQAEIDAQRVSNEFMRRHIHDFNPCEANGKVIGDWIINSQDKPLEWSLENLELALVAVRDKLAPVVTPNHVAVAPTPAPVVPANPEPTQASVATVVPAVVEAPATPVAAVPVPVAPVISAPAANPAPARRLPSGGVVPGSTQGGASSPAPADKYTKAELVKMDRKVFRTKLEREVGFRELVVKLFNPVRA